MLINIYAPNAYPDDPERYLFKLKYQYLLSFVVRKLQAAGRAVVLVGDLNATSLRMDHCEPDHFDYTSDGDCDDGKDDGGTGQKHSFESRPPVVWMRSLTSDSQPPTHTDHPHTFPRIPSSLATLLADAPVFQDAPPDEHGGVTQASGLDASSLRRLTGVVCGLLDSFRAIHPQVTRDLFPPRTNFMWLYSEERRSLCGTPRQAPDR